MKVLNQNLTVKEKQPSSISINTYLQNKKNQSQMNPHRSLGYHKKSKSYHIDPISKKSYLEDKNIGSSEDNMMHEKSSTSNVNNNLDLERIEEDPNNNSMISPQLGDTTPIENEEFAKFNISDEKFIRFLDKYLIYLEKNEDFNNQNPIEESLYNENDSSKVLKRVLLKYKKKCAECHSLQNNFWRQLQNFKEIEKDLQKVGGNYFLG